MKLSYETRVFIAREMARDPSQRAELARRFGVDPAYPLHLLRRMGGEENTASETEGRGELPVPDVRRPDGGPAHDADGGPRDERATVSPPIVPRLSVPHDGDGAPPLGFDWTTEYGASVLARKIVAYWEQRGCSVIARTERVSTGGAEAWCVRTDMVRGRPRRRTTR